ncbi:MAG: adenine phosphoribosyltransferase [Clostridia bacterium]|nr:adenine phosphoribosyltransferase [Clostridia bacterium]
MDLKSLVRSIPDFPKEGILFRDITPLIADADGFHELIGQMAAILKEKKVDVVVGPEARGFIFSAALAEALNVGLVLARKPDKLPYKTISYEYALEYGTDTLQIHEDSIKPGQRVAVVDDLLATGGTALACAKLCEKAGGQVVDCCFVIELCDLPGRETLKEYNVDTILQY